MKTIIRNAPRRLPRGRSIRSGKLLERLCPGCLEFFVLRELRKDPAFVKELDFVMEADGRIIGQNIFMRAVIRADDGRQIPIMTMGPICIAGDLKRPG